MRRICLNCSQWHVLSTKLENNIITDSKTFDKDLFYRLCKKYGVELSDEYDKPMLKEPGDTVRPLTDKDVLNILEVGR